MRRIKKTAARNIKDKTTSLILWYVKGLFIGATIKLKPVNSFGARSPKPNPSLRIHDNLKFMLWGRRLMRKAYIFISWLQPSQ